MTTTSTPETSPTGHTADADTVIAWHQAAARGGSDTPVVVDVRGAAEYQASHIRGSYHVPLATLATHTRDIAAHIEGPVVLVCQSGIRAEQARRHLAATGLEHAHVLDGGLAAYTAAGGDIVVGRQSWALERQVRLVAGALVLAGLTAGRLVSPKARLLAGGIGAGLTFSALSNTCAMGSALARLPLNRDVAEPEIGQTLAALRARRHERPRDTQR